ncbi:MAG: siderophore-interacting protein [Terrimesophilobacter sp.]
MDSEQFPGDTLIERGPLVRHEPAVRSLVVSRTANPSPGFRRLTFTGVELDGFSSLGATDHVKVILNGDVRRDFTPRAFRAADGENPAELDIDFFVHGEGVAARSAASIVTGDTMTIGGPRGSHLPPKGARRIVLGADESALPALARWIELIPEGVEILSFVELDNPSDAAYLDPDHVHRARVVWLEKSEGVLERAIRGVGPIGDDTFVWIAGEATTLIPIRRYLRRELGLPVAQVEIDGYWKRGESGRDHHAPVDPTDPDD